MNCKDKFGNIIKNGDKVKLTHSNNQVEYFIFLGIDGSKKDLIYFNVLPITSDFRETHTKIEWDKPKKPFVKTDPLSSNQLEII